jgi:hypothetical protein
MSSRLPFGLPTTTIKTVYSNNQVTNNCASILMAEVDFE